MKKDRAREIVQGLMDARMQSVLDDWFHLEHVQMVHVLDWWACRYEKAPKYHRLHHTTARPKVVAARPKNRARG